MGTVILAGLGRGGRPYLRAAYAAGFDVAVLDDVTSLASERTQALLIPSTNTLGVDGWDVGSWYSGLRQLVDSTTVAIVPFSEVQVLPTALVAEEFRLRGAGVGSVVLSQNKAMQRQLFAQNDVPQPDFYIAASLPLAEEYSRGRFPLVAKPTNRAGSSGVRLIRDEHELMEWHKSAGIEEAFLLEEFVSLPEFSIECVINEGVVTHLCVTEKVTTPLPYFVETAHVVPARLDGDEKEEVSALVDRVVAAIGVSTALMHLEVRGAGNDWKVIEFALRTPGDHILELHEVATGIDMFGETIRALAGQPVAIAEPSRESVAVAWFPEVAPGTVVVISGLDQALALDCVIQVRVDVEVGDVVDPLRSSDDRPVTVIVKVPTHADVQDALDSVAALLVIETTGSST